jgi:hypothetical protein
MSEHQSQPSPSIQAYDEPPPRPLQWIKNNSLPITGLFSLTLLICLVAHYSSAKIDWVATHAFIGSMRDVVQVLAFCAGGWWAYFKFTRGRTFQERLTPGVTGRFVSLDGVIYLVATIQIKNVGSSKIDFNHEVSALVLYEYIASSDAEIHAVADKRLTSFTVFKKGARYIEPNENIEVQQFIAIPGPLKFAYRLEIEVFSNSGFTSTATSVVDKSSLRDRTTDNVLIEAPQAYCVFERVVGIVQ